VGAAFQAGHAGSTTVAYLRTRDILDILAEIQRLTIGAYDLGKGSWLNFNVDDTPRRGFLLDITRQEAKSFSRSDQKPRLSQKLDVLA
jgi:hypothetical protein